MSQSYYGSLCLSDLIDKAKTKHPAFSKSDKNGKIYVNIQVWLNDTPDKFGNELSLQLSEKKEERVDGKAFYIGNCKKSASTQQPLGSRDINNLDLPSNIPNRTNAAPQHENLNPAPIDDLPF